MSEQPPYGTPEGEQPYGQPPFGAPPGQAPYGQPLYGQPPHGQAQYGQAPYGQAPYGQRPYGQPPYGQAGYGAPMRPGVNGFAIAGFVCAFLFSLLGVIFSAIALVQIKRTGQRGHGLAMAGLILSILFIIGAIAVFASTGFSNHTGTTY